MFKRFYASCNNGPQLCGHFLYPTTYYSYSYVTQYIRVFFDNFQIPNNKNPLGRKTVITLDMRCFSFSFSFAAMFFLFQQGGTNKSNNSSQEVRLPLDQGIAGHVASTGEVLNIRDAQAHPLFYRNIDQITGFTTRYYLLQD